MLFKKNIESLGKFLYRSESRSLSVNTRCLKITQGQSEISQVTVKHYSLTPNYICYFIGWLVRDTASELHIEFL